MDNQRTSFIAKTTSTTSLFLLIFLFGCIQLSAQEKIPDSVAKERINYIQHTLELGKPKAGLWWNFWFYGYSASALGQGAAFLASDKLQTRQDMALGAATCLIGAVGQLIMPMVPASAPGRMALLPGVTPEERIIKLNKAEELFEASAEREKEGRSWKMHVASGAVNLGGGLITWIGFDRTFKAGLVNFAINTAITEAQIWTQPTRAIKDYKNYCEKYKSGLPSAFYKPRASLSFSAFPGGMAMRLTF
jgi:hypothetical protein